MFSTPFNEVGFLFLFALVVVIVATRVVRLITGRPIWQVSIGEVLSALAGGIVSYLAVGLLFDSSLGWHVSETVFFILLIGGCLSGAMACAYLSHRLRW